MKKQPKTIRKKTKQSAPPIDLTGKRFGKWVVQKYAGKKGQSRLWLCRCDCGMKHKVYEIGLMKGGSKQCRRCAWDSYSKPLPNDFIGKRFGKWVVLKYAGKKFHQRLWLCHCDCGVENNVYEASLINKRSTKCLRCSWANRSLGHTKSYFAWQRLKLTGSLPKQWQEYNDFQEAVGDPPSNDARLARHDIQKPHAIGNTYWANPKSPTFSRQKLKKSKEELILGSAKLMKIRKAKTRDEMARCMITARKAGHTFGLIGLAAGMSRQAVHQIIKKHLKQ